jgi:hypothetical protein
MTEKALLVSKVTSSAQAVLATSSIVQLVVALPNMVASSKGNIVKIMEEALDY